MSDANGSIPELPAQAADYYAQGWWRRETFLDDLHAWARTSGDRPVFVNVRRSSGETVTVTFAELADQVERLASVLWDRGVRPGHVVVLQLPGWGEAAALWLACGRVGAVVVSLSPMIGARERGLILEGTKAGLLITIGSTVSGLETSITVFDLGDLLYASDSAAPLPPGERPRIQADALCQMLFTSGTTGLPKGILHSFNTNYAEVQTIARYLPENSVTAAAADLTHSAGLLFNLLSPLLTGCRTVFLEAADPDDYLDLLEQHQVRFFIATPMCLGPMAAAQRERPRDLSP